MSTQHQDELKIWQVDAFATAAFTGNPAAVCIVSEYPNDTWMQSLAAEMHLSETAFLVPLPQQNHFRLRWFTPAAEVDLCGHATLASTHVLARHTDLAAEGSIKFHTRSGILECVWSDDQITLDFPAITQREPASTSLTADVLQ